MEVQGDNIKKKQHPKNKKINKTENVGFLTVKKIFFGENFRTTLTKCKTLFGAIQAPEDNVVVHFWGHQDGKIRLKSRNDYSITQKVSYQVRPPSPKTR